MLFINALAFLGAAATAAAAAAAAVAPAAAAPSSLIVPDKVLDVELGLIFDSSVDDDANLSKRATEGLHLVNCLGNGFAYSIIIYCPDDGNCNRQPSSDNQCFMKSDGLYIWEGKTAGCGFTSGVSFRYTLPSDAWSRTPFTQVGTGSNSFKNYNVFHDARDGRVMYTAGNGAVCKSLYYILGA